MPLLERFAILGREASAQLARRESLAACCRRRLDGRLSLLRLILTVLLLLQLLLLKLMLLLLFARSSHHLLHHLLLVEGLDHLVLVIAQLRVAHTSFVCLFSIHFKNQFLLLLLLVICTYMSG